jgi:hypothetical protein
MKVIEFNGQFFSFDNDELCNEFENAVKKYSQVYAKSQTYNVVHNYKFTGDNVFIITEKDGLIDSIENGNFLKISEAVNHGDDSFKIKDFELFRSFDDRFLVLSDTIENAIKKYNDRNNKL